MTLKKVFSFSNIKKATIGITTFIFAVSTIAITSPAQPALADETPCRDMSSGAIYPYSDGTNYYFYSAEYRVPYSAACSDINVAAINHVGDPCAIFRVRFFPASGSSWTNGWKRVCSWSDNPAQWRVIASNIKNGTRYRVETKHVNRVYFRLHD